MFGLRLGNLLCLSRVSEGTSQHSSDDDDGTHRRKKKTSFIAPFYVNDGFQAAHTRMQIYLQLFISESKRSSSTNTFGASLLDQSEVAAIGRATALFVVRPSVANDELNHNNLPVNVRVVRTRAQPAPHAVNLAPLSLPAVSPKILDPHNNLCVRPDNGSHCHVSSRPAVALA